MFQANGKGQVSFEILLLVAIVFTMAIWIHGYYFEIKDSTMALQLARTHAISAIEEKGGIYVIEKNDFGDPDNDPATKDIKMELEIMGNPLFRCTDLDATALTTLIESNTGYETSQIEIELNGTDC